MLMVACDVNPQKFGHRRAWINLELQCFLACIVVLMVLLAFKARICGGGKEIGSSVLGCLDCCKNKEEKPSAEEVTADNVNAVAKDTGVM